MKKGISILMLTLLSVSLWALDVDLGCKLGYPFTFLYGQEYEADKAQELAFWDSANFSTGKIMDNLKPGFHGNFFCTVGILEYLAIQPEVAFSFVQSGYQLRYEKPGYMPFTIDITYDYMLVEIPILLKGIVPLNQAKSMLLSVFSGPELMIDLTTPKKTYLANNGQTVQTEVIMNDPDYFKHGAWSLVFGLGFDLFLRKKNPWYFTCDARYNLNLTSFNNSPPPHINDTRMHIVTLSFGAGWKIFK